MKKVISFISLLLLCCLFCSCESSKTITKEDLTETDYSYINYVYNTMSSWNTTHYDSGKDHYINKIGFYDFDGTDNLAFFINYPVGGCCGSGYYVNSDGLELITYDVYDQDTHTRHSSCLAKTAYMGTDWSIDLTDEQKYEAIKSAYITFLNSNL